ncbi:replication protein A 70 kDa DNA-binding subunit A [Cryptomeria japonica]|uniref:replication protein A 70 kDa DNA-binding subunit A n=1 Tax=Cryptomeria japonica TaxID=3369 RepID=UPI0027DA8DA9|nr:replication protein A 70 kDa DNA-binding subunit A [Cryptomeria japonica]XP_057854855.2 replication protein A 70 kDa DNA-binding subunit A [Cryptomeria japonica]
MEVSLTPNSIVAMNNGDDNLRPLVQVLDIRQISTTQSVQERYRLVVSDGSYMQQAMLATQLNATVKSGHLQKGSVVQLTEYTCNAVQNRKIIIVLNMNLIVPKQDIVGNPKQLTDTGVNAQHQPATSMQSAPQAQPLPQAQPAQNTMRSNLNMPPQSATLHMSGAGLGSYARTGQPAVQPVQSAGAVDRGMNPPNHPYGRPIVAHPYQPPPIYSNRGPIARNEAPARIIPIVALNPYQGRWTIKARVTAKGELRRFNNAKGDGRVFSFDLLDSDGGEIRVTCFNAVADQFYDRIESGRVYMISKGSLKPAQKNFNHLKNDWEIFLESSSTVELCLEEDSSIPKQHFSFRPISEIEDIENNSMVDIIGVVLSINPSNTILRRNGTETQKRTLQLKDMSGCSVELTMWGGFCNKEGQQLQELCDSGVFPILAVKAGRISDFGGKSVGTITTSQLFINPDLPESQQLRCWFDTQGKSLASQSITKDMPSLGRAEMLKTVTQIKDEGLGRSDKPDWIVIKATLSFIKVDNFCYTACTLKDGGRQCNKKVINNGDGNWYCEKCDKSSPECDYRYLLQCQVQDHTGLTWVTAFQEAGEEIMGVTAKELFMLKNEEQDDVKFGEIIRKVLFNKYIFKLKVKEETYNDEQRVKCIVVKTERFDYSSESKVLLDSIAKLNNGEFNNINMTAERSTNGGTTTGSYNAGYSGSARSYGSNNLATNNIGQNIGGGGDHFANSGGYGGTHSTSSNMYPDRIPPAYGGGNAVGGYDMRTGGYGGGY